MPACRLQVPSTWRATIEDPATTQLLLDYYNVTSPPLSSIALECLVRTAPGMTGSPLTALHSRAVWSGPPAAASIPLCS